MIYTVKLWGFPCGSACIESACNVEDLGLIPGLGRSAGKGKGYPLQYSGLENSMDCLVDGVAESQTWLSDFHTHTVKSFCINQRSRSRCFSGILLLFLWSNEITYMQNLKRWCKQTYLQNRNRLTDIENKLMVNKGEMWGRDKFSLGLTDTQYYI